MEKYTEGQWQNQVIHALGWYGWTWVHITNNTYNRAGVPDLLCFRGTQGLMLELKRMNGTLGVAQSRFIQEAQNKGTEVHVLRPCERDWEKLLELIR